MSAPLRVLVVDDEAPARAKLRRLVVADPRFVVVAEAEDGPAALARIEAERPDVVLLDVAMPGMSGLEVASALSPEERPVIIFSTAHADHALAAFELSAIDYLLKPYDASRLARALDRAMAQVTAKERASGAQWQTLLDQALPAAERRLIVKVDGAWIPLALETIVRAEAEGKYVRIHTASGAHVARLALKEVEERLPQAAFARVHRSELVRLDAVARLEPWTHGDAILSLKDGSTAVLSRTYRADFEARWTGISTGR